MPAEPATSLWLRLTVIASGIIGLLVGSGFGSWFAGWQSERYQAVRLQDGVVVRLNTKTGEMKVFVPVEAVDKEEIDRLHILGVGRSLEGRIPASEVKLVTDASAIERCDYLGYTVSNEDRKQAAMLGGDTLFRGKVKGGAEGVWVYRCQAR
jgi:hypothetical protein